MDNILNINNPKYLAKTIASQFKDRRIMLNITQLELSKKSGVSFGSLKRFETIAEISLKNLMKLAVVLNMSDFFYSITDIETENNITDLIKNRKIKKRKRARRSD